jgi:hypothetical protein
VDCSKSFVAFAAHFENEGKHNTLTLDFVEVPFSHTGKRLAEVFDDVLDQFGIKDKVSTKKKFEGRPLTFETSYSWMVEHLSDLILSEVQRI